MRLIGLDFGDRTVGVALSDPTGTIASPLETIRREDAAALKQTVRRIRDLVQTYDVHRIVLGYPRNMNNTEGPRAEKTLAFKKRLERDLYRVEIVLVDERLTTREAERPLLAEGRDRFRRKETVDQMAAALILQSYLDQQKEERGMEPENERITLFEPEEQLKSEMEVYDRLRLNGRSYFLAGVYFEDGEPDDEEDDEEEDSVFIFRECGEEESEFQILSEGGEVVGYVTTELEDAEADAVIGSFMESDSDDYELQIEDE